ncbi:MAG TPA: DUF2891 family protein [Candidatus Baltobacteraceae bacterium]|nr:DUF2891 family protein [Candidatus Baltobacteraceae bacterium]
MSTLHEELAPRIAPVVLANLTTRYPYHDTHLVRAGEQPHDPTQAHPAFGNSFDWHSSVHSHWTAVQLLDHFTATHADVPERAALRAAVDENLDGACVAIETAYLVAYPWYERPYGRAWALLLASAAPSEALHDMAKRVAEAAVLWLRVLPEPVRHGVHANTAFALGLMLDSARVLRLETLERTIAERAQAWFANDCAWPEHWERSGNDFLSPGLAQADLMRRLLAPDAFARWWSAFLPGLSRESRILAVVDVPNVSDGQIVHLHGLNLSRAGMLSRIAKALGEPALLDHARRLYRAGVEHAISGDYLTTHWLATFAWDAATSIDRAS